MPAIYSNNVVLNIQIGYGEINGSSLSPSAAAESAGFYGSTSYANLKNALSADSGNSTYQATADASLSASNPTGGSFELSSANAKALGLQGASNNLDGYVSMSNALPFEFNQTASSGKYDAVGALQHEFSEVMGRVGSVGASIGSGVYTPLDLFRYTSTNNSNPSQGTPERALTQQGPGTDYFSINGGATNLGNYNASNGSEDYSDWATNMTNDPFGDAFSGVVEPMSGNDAIEVAAIGWNLTTAGKQLAATAQSKPLV
jgi:hypothetical protein